MFKERLMKVQLLALLSVLFFAPRLLGAEPITLDTPTGTLYGTLELPKAQATWPVALILAGSGPTNRDGNSAILGGANDSLRLLAEGLAALGIASVRYDKRGIAASVQAGPKEADLRFDNYIDDAVLWGQKLQADKRFSRLVIIGHSEGSLIGMMAARKLKADGYVSIAGAGRAADVVLTEQLKAQLPPDLMKQSEAIIQSLSAGKTVADVPVALKALFRPDVQPYLISWCHYDPTQEITKLTMPMLILQGTTDVQVSVQDAKLLAKANPQAKLSIIDGMNHVFKSVEGDKEKQMRSYTDPALPVAPKLIEDIGQFIQGIKKP